MSILDHQMLLVQAMGGAGVDIQMLIHFLKCPQPLAVGAVCVGQQHCFRRETCLAKQTDKGRVDMARVDDDRVPAPIGTNDIGIAEADDGEVRVDLHTRMISSGLEYLKLTRRWSVKAKLVFFRLQSSKGVSFRKLEEKLE